MPRKPSVSTVCFPTETLHAQIKALLHNTYKVCLKSNVTGAITFLLTTELKINIIPFKVVPLGIHTQPETLFPLPVAVLEEFMWKCPQLVCYDPLYVVHSSKMTTFEVEFEFREKEKISRTQIM